MDSTPGSGRSPRVEKGNPSQCSCLGNPVDRGGYSPWGHKDWACRHGKHSVHNILCVNLFLLTTHHEHLSWWWKSVSCSAMSPSLWLCGLSMEFSRQECWSGLPFPSPRDLPDPGIEPTPPALEADSSLSELPGVQSVYYPKCFKAA